MSESSRKSCRCSLSWMMLASLPMTGNGSIVQQIANTPIAVIVLLSRSPLLAFSTNKTTPHYKSKGWVNSRFETSKNRRSLARIPAGESETAFSGVPACAGPPLVTKSCLVSHGLQFAMITSRGGCDVRGSRLDSLNRVLSRHIVLVPVPSQDGYFEEPHIFKCNSTCP